jgi:hypothetical protein
MSTPRQVEANRRNAQKSTGPRTQEGKDRSRFNGVKHGMTAKFDVLPGEDAAALTGRIDAWTADFQPRNQLERDLIERAVRVSWQLDRVEQAYVARLTANILKATSGENQPVEVESDVLTLGTRLFQDLTKPHGFSPGIVVDPNNPALIVPRLESSGPGCRWLLDRWAEVRSLLEQDQPWQSPDKLRAIRLLGRHPLDALDEPQVANVFLACHTIDSSGGELFHEIWNELRPEELTIARQRLAGPSLERLRPRDRTEAREALLQIVERAVGRLETKADAHRQRAESDAASAADRLAFDDSRGGEILRNYASSCSRALMRTIDALFKMVKARTAAKLVPAAAAVESSTEPGTASDHGITQTEPNFLSIENTVTESAATVDHGITQTEPNFLSIENTVTESAATVDHGITQTEPNFPSIENTVTDSVAASDHGITQTEPNSVSIETTVIESVLPSDHGITETEPNSVSIETTEDFSSKGKVPYRDDRQPRASPRKRCRRGCRGDWHVPLNTTRPTRAFGAGRRAPPDRSGQGSRTEWAAGRERATGWVESRHDPPRVPGRIR